jgi:hypothetical protein
MQHEPARLTQCRESGRRDFGMSFIAVANRAGNHALRENDPPVTEQARSGAGDNAVLAGAARTDDENQRTTLGHGIRPTLDAGQ